MGGDLDSIPGLGRAPGGGHDNPLQYSLPGESPWTEEPGGAIVHGVGWTRLIDFAQHNIYVCACVCVCVCVYL